MDPKPIRIIPYSYSSLTGFETCALKHHGERLTKEFARPYNKAADDGDTIHKQAENYIKDGTPFDNPYKKQIMSVCDEFRAKGTIFAERELAVTKDKQPTGWWADDCHTRAKMDLSIVGEKEAWIIDWKTGRSDPHSTQLKHSAMLLMMHHPEIEKVHTRYEWLKEKWASKATIHRDFLEQDWAKFEKRLSSYQAALKKNVWQAKKGFLCKKYCGVHTCENHGK